MKKAQRIIVSVIAFILVISMAACAAAPKNEDGMFDITGDAGMNNAPNSPSYGYPNANKGESALEGGVTLEGDADASPEDAPAEDIGDKDEAVDQNIYENPFIKVEEMDTSTFSADVDTASYTFLRKMINQGYSLSELQNTAKYNVLRTEEMVNYFKYDYASPAENEAFGVNATISKSPWNDETYLMMLGIKATEIEEKTANNLVFLIDASGSMSSADKLPLLQEAFVFLTEQLDENDTVSIVTYAGSERVVLEGASGNKKQTIIDAINDLKAGGSTNGEAGINKAYEIAEVNFKPGGNNRIILASDGDLNVGIRDPEQLEKLVEEKRNSGIFLSVLGFGTGNFRDSNMSAIAQTGNGVYHYIDCSAEAERIFTDSLLSTIYTVAKDVKFQLTFDKEYVSEYRLIGYENRMLANEDFDDDTKDAGEVGSGHTLTVCYELKLKNRETEEIRPDWVKLAIRYKQPDADISKLSEYYFGDEQIAGEPDEDFVFATTVIEFSMLLRNSKYAKNEITLESLIERLDGLTLDTYKAEFKSLLNTLANKQS
ncbi:MAG: von Willebrand factor type A domain-containing protein [Clostridia bacterium]|nr:von Willebrand factor type A domain-containing protein [Clostridia bacterium]